MGHSKIKKGITQFDDLNVRLWLDSLSKHALADLAIDFVRRDLGDVDGEALLDALVVAFRPIAEVRGDRIPRTDLGTKMRLNWLDIMRTRKASLGGMWTDTDEEALVCVENLLRAEGVEV